MKDVYFGYYRIDFENYKIEREKGHLNIYLVSPNLAEPKQTAKLLESIGEQGGKAWLYIWGTVVAAHAPIRFFDNWKERLNNMMSYLKECGVLSHLLGFYLDEPFLCGFTKEDYITLTRKLITKLSGR